MGTMRAPLVDLLSGVKVPIVGLGTWKAKITSMPVGCGLLILPSVLIKHKDHFTFSKPGQVLSAVKAALTCGYRHIDCAPVYGNEKEVGLGIKTKLQDGTLTRSDLFVTSKLWNEYHSPEKVEPALKQTLSDLQLDYVDLYLMHWSFAWKKVSSGAKFGTWIDEDVDYVDTWLAMEKLVEAGMVKSIGLSNFKIRPAMLQVEVHPYLKNSKLVDLCQRNGITVTAYSPFASPDPGRFNYKETDPCPLSNERIKRTPAQVILRWLIQRDIVAIPKSISKERIESNLDVFSFTLTQEDMDIISNLDVNFRCCGPFPESQNYPFHEEF